MGYMFGNQISDPISDDTSPNENFENSYPQNDCLSTIKFFAPVLLISNTRADISSLEMLI